MHVFIISTPTFSLYWQTPYEHITRQHTPYQHPSYQFPSTNTPYQHPLSPSLRSTRSTHRRCHHCWLWHAIDDESEMVLTSIATIWHDDKIWHDDIMTYDLIHHHDMIKSTIITIILRRIDMKKIGNMMRNNSISKCVLGERWWALWTLPLWTLAHSLNKKNRSSPSPPSVVETIYRIASFLNFDST